MRVPYSAVRIRTKNTHGTGCTLSSAIAAQLPQSADVPEACKKAKEYLTGAISAADRLSVGSGYGPTHHFWNLWHQ
ncbi:phosphomethylpyrimidine kinase [gut metagenome]|uniref:Phosphomethylpyrimidine kinase n=1 Tax=gut metagenome TaxID=749906 RepID=J9H132_9ZZZZ